MSVALSVMIACVSCGGVVKSEKNQPFVKYELCGRKQLSAKCKKDVNGILQVRKKDVELELNFDRNVFSEIFSNDNWDRLEDMEEKILLIEGVDVQYVKDRAIRICIHEEK